MEDKGVWIYDIETLKNCFTYYAINRDTEQEVFFVIWDDINHLPQLLEHLSSIKGQIGFNNINFDYPVLHKIINSQSLLSGYSCEEIADFIYNEAQTVISTEFSSIKENQMTIPQLDLFRIWHFDNKAKMTSLKKLQIAMGYDNVQDMPYKHDSVITDINQVVEIIEYNRNDVISTFEFYKKTIPKLDLRRGIKNTYGLNCLNYSDSKIGEELMLKLYCNSTGKQEQQVKKLRTRRREFKFNECIPLYVNFKTDNFNSLLEYLKTIVVTELKQSFSYTFEYKGFEFDLGTGGIHGCIKPGVYEADDNFVIIDSDVASLYPSLAIANNLYPQHLGEEFARIYENGIVKPRLEAKRNGDKVMADGFKLSSNSVYGKSASEYSFLYDPLYTLKTTLAGQLSLCMLSEMLLTSIPDLTMLQINTDGLTSRLPKSDVDKYYEICKDWERITKLVLEHVEYSKMIIRDVNNYVAVSIDGKVKNKGLFKTNEEMINDGEYHKSFSQGIVPVALSKFFLEGVEVEKTIRECTDIYLFCKTGNTTGSWVAETFDVDENGEILNLCPMQKNNRYYLSKSGVRFRKSTTKIKDGEEVFTSTEYEADKRVVIFNKFKHFDDFSSYDVDYDYYVEECYKILDVISGEAERREIERREEVERLKKEREENNFIKFCVDKIPTVRQYEMYKKDWLIEKYGEIQTRWVKN